MSHVFALPGTFVAQNNNTTKTEKGVFNADQNSVQKHFFNQFYNIILCFNAA